MIFARLQINDPNGYSNEPFLFCKNCRSNIIFNSKFCPNCGHKYEKHNPEPQMFEVDEEELANKRTEGESFNDLKVRYLQKKIDWKK